jgi:hypothetical protein
MRENIIDIWSYLGQAVIVVTTNGSLTRDGRAIPGRGVARQASEKFPEMRARLGEKLAQRGNHVHEIIHGLVSFPVEDTAWSQPDKRLIRRSAEELKKLVDQQDWPLVVVPRPGCGGGGLPWEEIKPLLIDLFDDRFIVVSAPEQEK